MKQAINKVQSGYIKVSNQLMLSRLLTPIVRLSLQKVQNDEVDRINRRFDRSNYISKAENQYLTTLYIDAVLNNKYQQKETEKIMNIRVISPEIITKFLNNKSENKSIFTTV